MMRVREAAIVPCENAQSAQHWAIRSSGSPRLDRVDKIGTSSAKGNGATVPNHDSALQHVLAPAGK